MASEENAIRDGDIILNRQQVITLVIQIATHTDEDMFADLIPTEAV
jgi:hypothetical protein